MSEMTINRDLDGLTFYWAQWELTCALSRFKPNKDGMSAELTIYMPLNGKVRTLTSGVVNLSALVTRDRLIKRLTELAELVDWRRVVETVCVRGVQEYRRGEPIESLEPSDQDTPTRFVLNPYVYDNHPTLLYGPGDSGKSFLALYWACLLASGGMENGLSTHPDGHNVLYLNWEMQAAEMRTRVKMLRASHPGLTKAPLHRWCVGPLSEFAPDLKAEVVEKGIGVVIIDSLAPATGGEITGAEPVVRFFQSLSSLRCASILIGHVAKGGEGKEATAYGSVFYFNLSRSVYEVKKIQEEESGSYRMALYHRKNNLGRRQAATGFALTVDDDKATVSQFDPAEDATLSMGLPLHVRISQKMADGHEWTAKLLSDYLCEDLNLVRKTLNQHVGAKWKRTHEGKSGRGDETTWRILQ